MTSQKYSRAFGVALVLGLAAYTGWYNAAHGQAQVSPRAEAPTKNRPPHAHNAGDAQRCTECHETLPDGRLRTRFPDRRLKPQSTWLGLAHDQDWIVRHRWVAADRGDLCAQCHKERDCTSCHDGRNRPRAIHPNDWLTLHPQQARRSATDCQGCHALQTFCAECHARLGISQTSAPEVRTGARIHPPAAQWTGAINQHGREAKRSLSACVSCHAEQDCVRCHAAGINAARSPHPSGFRERCGALLAANSRACVACHGADLSSLRAACSR